MNEEERRDEEDKRRKKRNKNIFKIALEIDNPVFGFEISIYIYIYYN